MQRSVSHGTRTVLQRPNNYYVLAIILSLFLNGLLQTRYPIINDRAFSGALEL